jgi:hypothetical protein
MNERDKKISAALEIFVHIILVKKYLDVLLKIVWEGMTPLNLSQKIICKEIVPPFMIFLIVERFLFCKL